MLVLHQLQLEQYAWTEHWLAFFLYKASWALVVALLTLALSLAAIFAIEAAEKYVPWFRSWLWRG